MISTGLDVAWWLYVIAPVAFLGVLCATPLVMRWARRMDWLAYPREDRWHARPTALMGGIAIYAGATLSVVWVVPQQGLWSIWAGASLMFAVGLVDDLKSIRPAAKLAAQIVATGLLLYAGYAFGVGWPFWISLPLTFLWVVGITNALNLLDNMDGLAAGIAAIAALVMAVFAILIGNTAGAALALAIVGAAGGFLVFNFKPARIFMGDCGSLFLGYSIAALPLIMQSHLPDRGLLAPYLVPLAALAVPIFDTTLVTLARKLAGRSIAQGGRDHSSHRLVFLGLTERAAVCTLYGISFLAGGLTLFFLFVDVKLFYALVILCVVALLVLGVHLARANVYEEDTASVFVRNPADGTVSYRDMREADPSIPRPLHALHALFGHHWKSVFGVVVDTLLIIAAFIIAHFLRFESGLPAVHERGLVNALPVVVAVKVTVFYAFGLYLSVWRHAGTPEVVRIVSATAAGSAFSAGAIGLLFGWSGLSVAVLLIDWMTITLAVMAARFGFRGLRQYLAAQRREGTRVLLYGAGDAGILTLRELRQNPRMKVKPVGFIDDDPLKQRQRVQGVPVVGRGSDLPRLCAEHDIEEVLITVSNLPQKRRAWICGLCDQAGVGCRSFALSFEPVYAGDGTFQEAPSADQVAPRAHVSE